MAYICQEVVEIPFLCSSASQRLVHMSFFSDSQITRPALKINTSQATIVIGPNVISTASTWQSSGTSTGPGIYHLVLAQSECSSQGVPGYAMLYTSTATTGPYYIRLRFPRVDSYNTQDMGVAAFSEVSIHAGTHSNVTFKGIENYANVSNVTLHAGTHSSVTIQGVTRLNSSVTLNAAVHSGATVRGVENYANLPTLVELTASSITSMAIAVVNRTIDNTGFGGRTVGSALAGIRNKVVITDSTITVYDTDDTTVLWGGSIVAGGTPLSSVDPG
jgi:hypothetical protein